MQTLKFLGRGSAFNTTEGNTSAYFIKDNIFFLIDCGETVFHKLIANDKLKNLVAENEINEIDIYITHLHSDHVGSLSSLIYYCFYILNITPNIYHPQKITGQNVYVLDQLLKLQGHTNQYVYLKEPYSGIFPEQMPHDEHLMNYGYTIFNAENKIFFSGDCSEIPRKILTDINNGYYNEVYLESCLYSNSVHAHIEYLNEVITKDKHIRNRIYLMHIDNLRLLEIAKKYGFKIVELDK